ncbi:hypothetical protein BE20_16115 [Sorangium cellulosum]|nr:hypothetical protein BE20_16115 [Sorangium cellulosum]
MPASSVPMHFDTPEQSVSRVQGVTHPFTPPDGTHRFFGLTPPFVQSSWLSHWGAPQMPFSSQV